MINHQVGQNIRGTAYKAMRLCAKSGGSRMEPQHIKGEMWGIAYTKYFLIVLRLLVINQSGQSGHLTLLPWIYFCGDIIKRGYTAQFQLPSKTCVTESPGKCKPCALHAWFVEQCGQWLKGYLGASSYMDPMWSVTPDFLITINV